MDLEAEIDEMIGNFSEYMPDPDMRVDSMDPNSKSGPMDIQIFTMNMTSINMKDVVRLMDSNFFWFLLSLVCAISWIVYITFYNSRITGLLVTKVINWKRLGIIKNGYLKAGSLSFSVLSGKIMFRDVAFINEDFSIRVQDGWIIFRWWRKYLPKDISEDMSHSDTRLSILLNGVELHLYNRSELYARLEKLFNLDPYIIPGGSKNIDKDSDMGGKAKPPSAVGYSWRDLIPVIKLELCSGRIVFGSLLVPYTLAIVVEETHLIYTTKSAASKYDHFMHIIKCKAENFKVMLSPSPKYTGLKDEPPRLMGEGFGILTSNKVELYYYMDEPGIVPNEIAPQRASDDEQSEYPPIWGIDIKCGRGTDFSYGPWADRQRELLYKLFFPQDFQPLKPSKIPKPGEPRQIQSFDIRVSTLTDATIDILFSKDEETNAVHMNTGPGSYLEITIPWVVAPNGYSTKITGQFLHVETSTSIQFRDLVQGESLQFNILAHYPLQWNSHQQWDLNLTACKASAYLIYAHKWFFQALINDWSSRTPPDILHFVPYTWSINLYLKEFEIITLTNEYNWVDCASSQNHENGLMAACGELFHLSFDLTFHEFLPETVFFKFWIQVEGGDLNIYIPETNTSYNALASLAKNAKIRNRDGSTRRNPTASNITSSSYGGRDGKFKKWRNICIPSDGWIDCWSVPLLATQIGYTYHPMPPLGPTPQADVTTPEKEELLLSPMRMRGESNKRKQRFTSLFLNELNPLTLPPDKVEVELEVGPSILLLYGTLLKLIINLKENIFGDYQDFIDMEKLRNLASNSNFSYRRTASFNNVQPGGAPQQHPDPREFRPFEVTVSVILHDIQAHLLKNCNETDPPCPSIWVERFGFEMNKRFHETILQVLLSPIILTVSDNLERESGDKHLEDGYLMLSALQIRGHAMFSNEGRDLDQETLEYAWLIEIIIGKLSGRLTTPHLENIISGCEAFFLLVLDTENDIRSPHNFLICHHGNNQFECALANMNMETCQDNTTIFSNHYATVNDNLQLPSLEKQRIVQEEQMNLKICPSSEEIKYRMIRVSMDAVDVYLSEVGTALNLWISPIRFSLCNLHGSVMKEGFTLLIPNVQLRHFVLVNPSFTKRFQFSDLNIVQSSSDTMTASWNSKGEANTSLPQSPTSTSAQQSWSYLWLEIGAITLGPFSIEIGMGSMKKFPTQNSFLIKHDRKTKRLWFLWNADKLDRKPDYNSGNVKKCGCVGGCSFFGENVNGDRFFFPSHKDLVDGINVAHFRINNVGEVWGFGQSILREKGLVFDTPPYTAQGVSLLDMPSDWTREAHKKSDGKTPFTFKPSLLADFSTTSSSQPSTIRSLQSGKGRKNVSGGQPQLKRQTKVGDQPQGKKGSESKGGIEDEHYLKTPDFGFDNKSSLGRSSYCSDSKQGTLDHFHTADEMSEMDTEIFQDVTMRRERRVSTSSRPTVSSATIEESFEEDTKKPWHGSMSSLDSLSDVSFISALSVQEECMVNLQMHLNKPIAESSLLMPCYMSHLTQLKCDNWLTTGPNIASSAMGLVPFVQLRDGKLLYAGSKYTPQFDPLVDGFTTLAMVPHSENPTSESSQKTPPHSFSMQNFWETPPTYGTQVLHPLGADDEFYRAILTDSLTEDSKFDYTTVIIRAKNDINIMVSPMLLEALQRFIEAITPTLSRLHPLTVVNRLHNECISRVEKANLLKKEKSVLLNRMQNSKRNTAIRSEETSPVHSNLLEEVSLTAFQGSISIPKINVTLLQASVVEEVISFSALDNIRDLMCVSLLAVAIDNIQMQFLFREQTKKTLQVLHRPTILPKTQKKRKSKISTSDSMLSEPVFIENSEKQSELISSSIDILRIHAQLRRLKNDSSILREAVSKDHCLRLTAIPNQHSKVLFRFAKIPCSLQFREQGFEPPRERLGSVSEDSEHNEFEREVLENAANKCPDEKLGFIMCECGLEGISIKGVKNSESPQKLDEEKEETVSITLCNEANLNERNSTPNLNSVTDTFVSFDRENNTMGNSKEELPNDQTPPKSKSPSPEKAHEQNKETVEKDIKDYKGSASSCVIHFQTMWYNFAAPPQTPITRKIDYTRMDWNLLSTASTAINAWLNPIDQITIAIITLMKGHSKRATGLLASLMADALEVQSIHQPIRSKYIKLTPLAKTLQEDPSCQLFNVLQRYISQTSMDKIEGNVGDDMPQLSTLRQGVIVLSRQWKNVLYTPLLLEHNLKSKKTKFTVTFTLPQSEEESPGSDGEMSGEETTDERATLLDTEGGTVSLQSMRFNRRSRGSEASSISESSISRKVKTLPSQPQFSSTRASDVYPLTDNQQHMFTDNINNMKDKKGVMGSMTSVITGNCSLATNANEEELQAQTPESGRSTPGRSRKKRNIIRQVNEWNANNEAQRLSAILSDQSHEESLLLGAHSKFPQHPSLLLLDAHVIFQPLLSSLGLMPQQIMGNNFEKLGSHMSIRASIDTLKIDIVESEVKGIGRGSVKGKSAFLNIPTETPAFLCEKIGLEGDFQKSTDLTRDLSNRGMIYLSRNYCKKQAKSALIFSLNIDYISQQVNMPLLRLLHQITTMCQNVRETQLELREQRPFQNIDSNVAGKNGSSSGSEDHKLGGSQTLIHPKEEGKPPTTIITPLAVSAPNILPTAPISMPKSAMRTQSFAQRFKSTSRAVRGHRITIDSTIRNSSTSQTPTSVRAPDFPDTARSSKMEQDIVTELLQPAHPTCWKTIYYLLDLYATRPETKTIINSRSGLLHDSTDAYRSAQNRLSAKISDAKEDDVEKGISGGVVAPQYTYYPTSSLEKQKELLTENPKFAIFGVARIQKTRLLASLSGLKLEAEIMNLQASASYKKKPKPLFVELSLTGHVGSSMIVLLEGIAPNQQTVVKVSIAKSGALYSSLNKRAKEKNSGMLTIGPVNVDIPQHPVVLHGMMTRSTKQLSSTLQEFRVNRTLSRISRGTTFDEIDFAAHLPQYNQANQEVNPLKQRKSSDSTFFQPLVMQFTVLVESLSITASLLPSLQAQYKMENVKSCGYTGSKAKFQIKLPTHNLSFTTRITMSEANLPSAASISLPQVDVFAEYIQQDGKASDAQIFDGVLLRRGSYLSSSADIGPFEHCLTTDLLNHLLFVQKVFMKEVNEVVLKMSGGDKPVPLWDEESSNSFRSLLFTLVVKLQSIQITATTPTNTAVRLETGLLEFQMSNRVRGMNKEPSKNPQPTTTTYPTMSTSTSSSHPHQTHRHVIDNKVFVKAQVDVNLSLGQLIRNIVFEEAESEYQQYAFFKTRINLRNALSNEMSAADADKEVILITLTRPLIYVQPIAVDKAILVWLNYKNAYEYWNEQRSSLNTEVLAAMPTQIIIIDRPHQDNLNEQSSILFLQLTVNDMGISIPLNPSPHSWAVRGESENRGAVVVTLESTSISACSSGSLVSSGRFNGLCFRFSDDMASMDDWKPNLRDPSVMNFCVVSEGTYEVCSKTTSQNPHSENAMWFLNVKWQMEGVDMHVDVNIGKQLSALGHTLTTLAAFEEEDDEIEHKSNMTSSNIPEFVGDNNSSLPPGERSVSQEFLIKTRPPLGGGGGEQLPSYFTDASLNPKQKRNMLEKEMQERANTIEDLKRKSAPQSRIEEEQKKLQELEIIAFRDFRRDWIKKLRRQSTKASIKDKFGLGPAAKPKALAMRSKSFAASSPDKEVHPEANRPGLEMVPPSPNAESESHSSRPFNKSKPRVTFGETQRQFSVDSANMYTSEEDEEDIGFWLENDIEENKEGHVTMGGHMTPGSSISAHKAQEPNVDLELDVKVFINSGKCVLHTKPKEEEQEIKKKNERSGSGYDALLHIGSPLSSRKMRHNLSSSRLKSPIVGLVTSTYLSDTTIFHIPGLDVKIHYNSHILYDDREREPPNLPHSKPTHERSDSGSSTGTTGGGGNTTMIRKGGTKKASLFAWTTLHSVPEETIISPHILDFLEQTLEPLPGGHQKSLEGISVATDAASGMYSTYYASFPVDVVVFFHMKPSTFRFSCQPVSRVECMLRLPSLDIVFSSKRAEEEQSGEKSTKSHSLPSSAKQVNFSQTGSTNSISKEKESVHYAIGGISVTGCLSDFSLYIFHPYGAAKKAAVEWSPLSDNERKDSVSMNVEFIKFHLVRSRKIHMASNPSNPSLADSKLSNDAQQAAIRFSTIVDIGSASFKYDMRRLTEILAFPKAWYRRSIVRRLFLGDLTTTPYGDDSMSSQGTRSRSSSPHIHRDSEDRGNYSHQKEPRHRDGEKEVVKRRGSKIDFFSTPKTTKMKSEDSKSKESIGGVSYWDTLVLFAVNFTKLNVQMNMGNVMGNVSWLIRDAKSEGRFSIGSTGHKNLYIGIGLDSSYIDAKGGIVAGTFELSRLNTFVKAKEDPGVEPHHHVGFKMFGLELRLDFMGTSVLMGRVSGLEVVLKDEWQVRGIRRQISEDSLATFRPAVIFIHGDLLWDQLQLMISKSTTVDLLKMHCKLEEFFSQQFKSSKWVFSTLQNQEISGNPSTMPKKSKRRHIENGLWEDPRHHRHWQQVLEKVSGLTISSLLYPLPATGTVLGGTMDLHGNNISLACFHGVNFKAKSWALFSLKQPFISFSTEAQETHAHEKDDRGTVHIVQNLNFSLGQSNQQSMPISSSLHESMAIVCRVTRNVLFPPQFRTLQEWFHYAFAPSEIDDVQRFPSLERERERIERERADSGGSDRRSTPARLHDPNHNREVIFALPNMELFFKTEHLQSCDSPESSPGYRPMVECSFITEFGDHIFVTVDAEAFFFLHDLITSYVKEKEKLVSAQLAAGRSSNSARLLEGNVPTSSASLVNETGPKHPPPPPPPSIPSSTSNSGLDTSFQRDWRDYHCKTWQLEPTVRLLSWAGKSIEPYGVDYILHKLGFSHARITIPKWMQRGFMDPLDLVLSVLVLRMIDLPKSEASTQNREDSNNESGRGAQ